MDIQSEGRDLYTTIDEDNIAWLHFDKQNASTNVLSASVLEAFYDELLELVERAPRGLVILSDKSNGFIAGADVNEFIHLENHDEAINAIQRGQEVLDRLRLVFAQRTALDPRHHAGLVLDPVDVDGDVVPAIRCRQRLRDRQAGLALIDAAVKRYQHQLGGLIRAPVPSRLIGAGRGLLALNQPAAAPSK